MLRRVYAGLPSPLQRLVADSYRRFHPGRASTGALRRNRDTFVETFFDSREQYERYVDELDQDPVATLVAEASTAAATHRDYETPINEYFSDIYAYVRRTEPETVVETGVRDGWSTLYILAALQQNGAGTLHSVDFPVRADESTDEFAAETSSYDSTVPTIPAGEDPGWILPDPVTDRWQLHVGKSQARLPELTETLPEIDVFLHDSDHSLACMVFEYELAWECFGETGLLFSDDIHWNDAFELFTTEKGCHHGRLKNYFGYAWKSPE